MPTRPIIATGSGTVRTVTKQGDYWVVIVDMDDGSVQMHTVSEAYVGGCERVNMGTIIGNLSEGSASGGDGDTIESLVVTGTTTKTIKITMVSGEEHTATWTDLNDGGSIVDNYVTGGGYADGVLTLTRTGGLGSIVIPIENRAPIEIVFKVGAPNFPAQGATIYTPLNVSNQPILAGKDVNVFREGELQFISTVRGIAYDMAAGKITFYPDLYNGEDIIIQEKGAVSTGSVIEDSALAPFYEVTLGAVTQTTILQSVHGISVPRDITLLTPARRVMDVYCELRSNGDVYVESNVSLNNHILKIY